MTATTTWTGFGAPAFDALAEAIAAIKATDPMAPVTVVTPSASSGLALRRALARRSALVGVTFQGVEAVAERLAAPLVDLSLPGAVPTPGTGPRSELSVAAVRVELTRRSEPFAAIASHRSTWEVVASAVADIADLPASVRADLAARSPQSAEVVRIHDAVRSHLGLGGRAAIFGRAAARLTDTPAVAAEVGGVVFHLPDSVPAGVRPFVDALCATTDVFFIGGLSGDAAADRLSASVIAALGGTPPGSTSVVARGPDQVLSANDVDDEVGAAVRLLLARAEGESPIPLHQMAIVHPGGSPYTGAVAEVLRASGIPFSAPSVDTLAHCAAGRVLLAVFDIVDRGFSRQSVIDLWASGVVVGPDGGALPAVHFDERTRRLGIVGDRSVWHDRIDARVEELDLRRAEAAAKVASDLGQGDPEWAVAREARRAVTDAIELEQLAALDQAFAAIEDWVDGIPTRWQDVASWVDAVLDEACGPRARRRDWPEWELDADSAVRVALGRLRALAQVDPDPRPEMVIATVRAALGVPAPRRDKVGTGLTVTTLDDPPIRPHDVVVILGMAEGHVPRVHREDVVLGDGVRATAGLVTSMDHTARQRRALAMALEAATDAAVMTYARCDQRSGRTQVPSRWLVDGLEARTGTRPGTETLMHGHESPGVVVINSHTAAVRDALAPGAAALHRDEFIRAALAGATDFDAHPAAGAGTIHLAATLIRSRRADAFTRFDGNLDGDGHDVVASGRHLSPTSLEQYAECPRRWFFNHALGIGTVDRPEVVDQLQPRDKGTLAHRILERFIGEAIEDGTVPEAGRPWPLDARGHMARIAMEEFASFERRGLVGHPTWWDLEQREILTVLGQTLVDDDRLRAAESATPVAVELTFGRHGVDPLEVSLDDGRTVRLAGQADRVDVVPGGVMVHDYKYSGSGRYASLRKPIERGGDPVAGGTRMQLLAYAEAAAQQYDVAEASAWYWFLRPSDVGTRIGYVITDAHRAMFRTALATLVDGIGRGHYPARSGPMNWFWGTNDHCGFCDFKAVCPDDREEEWERVKDDPSLDSLRTLVEDGAPALVADAEGSNR